MKLLKVFTVLTWVTFLEEDSKENPRIHASESLLQNSGHTLCWEVILIPTCSRVEGVSWKSLKEIQILRLQCNALKFHCHLSPKSAFTGTTQLLTLLSRWSCLNLSTHLTKSSAYGIPQFRSVGWDSELARRRVLVWDCWSDALWWWHSAILGTRKCSLNYTFLGLIMCQPLFYIWTLAYSLYWDYIAKTIIPTIQIRKLRSKDVKECAQVHPSRKKLKRDLGSSSPHPENRLVHSSRLAALNTSPSVVWHAWEPGSLSEVESPPL